MTTMEVPDIIDTAMESVELAPRINGFHLEPRCRVCRNDILRIKVNDMLATGTSYAMILRALREDNDKLGRRWCQPGRCAASMAPPAAIRCAQVHRSSPQVHETRNSGTAEHVAMARNL
jgi:hypothetical protein